MPRVRISSTKYKLKDLPLFIKRKLVGTGMTQKDIANHIGIKPSSFTNRMQKGLFSYAELIEILDLLNATDEEILNLMRKEMTK